MKPELSNDDLKTLSQCMNSLKKFGFDKDFQVTENGISAAGSNKVYKPEEVKIANFYRFEGETDPADSAVLYAIETADGEKGTLSDSYGAYADKAVADFIVSVEKSEKKHIE